MVVIAGEVIAGVKLKAVAIGIADVKEERVGNTMPSGTALDILQVSARGHHITQMQNVHGGRHPIGEMVQARAFAVGDSEIVNVALAVQPGGGDPAVLTVLLGILGQAEAEPGVEIDGVLNLGGKDIEMVEPLRMAALVKVIAAQQMRALVHRRIELDPKTERVGEIARCGPGKAARQKRKRCRSAKRTLPPCRDPPRCRP